MARRSFSSFSPPSFPVRSSLLSPFCFSAHLSPPSPSFSPRQLHLPPSALTTTACRFSSLRGPPPSFCYFCSASSLSSSSSSLGRWKDSLFVSSCSSPFSRRSFIPDIPSPRRSHPPSSSVSSCSSSSSSLSSSSSSLSSSSSSSSSLSSLTFSFPLFPSRRFFTKAHLQRRSDDALPCLRVMTYNILHKLDARRAKFFSYSQPANLQSETRLARVRDELRDLQPHVACLQRQRLAFEEEDNRVEKKRHL